MDMSPAIADGLQQTGMQQGSKTPLATIALNETRYIQEVLLTLSSRSLFSPSPAGNSSDLLKRSSIQQLYLILPIPFSKLNGMRSGDFRLEKMVGKRLF